MNRRSFLSGLLAAPAIVALDRLMPIPRNPARLFRPPAFVTPAMIRERLLQGMRDAIPRDLIVERDLYDPSRVNVFAAPNMIQQLRTAAQIVERHLGEYAVRA